ncbi:Rpr2-domain-containing protein [Dacryopinax primogenitus]|uniref:Rpr2-domain-containing protein n=1 Tax=Dacryopinax primogenitus (strain DJM 731) TaxID=1858805 RepID=M5G8D7_DACPD|nr:Rpr2-domain-containing protein [Dacryopinax primogenitus]EJU04420.1 Rpr2-domain-containing protein [Dacryopinax primogenitus]
MAKKDHQAAPTAAGIQNREALQRMNFLYQASAYLANAASLTGGSNPEGAKALDELSRQYTKDMSEIALKTVTKLDPTIKRTICSRCGSVLLPGRTSRSTIKFSGPHGHRIRSLCVQCGDARNVPAPPLLDEGAQLDGSSLRISHQGVSTKPVYDADISDTMPTKKSRKRSRKARQDNSATRKRQDRRHRPLAPSSVPLFAREAAGHALFVRNVRVDAPLS